MMRNKFKLFCVTAAIASCMSIPAFAAETKEEYQSEAAVISADLENVDAQLESLKNANNAVSDKYKALCAERKESGNMSLEKDVWDQVKELHKEAAQYRVSKDDVSYKSLRASAKESLSSDNYDAALDSLKQILESKKARLEKMEKTNELMQQIDALLSA